MRFPHSHRATTAIYFSKTFFPKGAFLTACTFSLQAHSSIRKDFLSTQLALSVSSRETMARDSWRQIRSAVSTVLRRQDLGGGAEMGGALSIGRFAVSR